MSASIWAAKPFDSASLAPFDLGLARSMRCSLPFCFLRLGHGINMRCTLHSKLLAAFFDWAWQSVWTTFISPFLLLRMALNSVCGEGEA